MRVQFKATKIAERAQTDPLLYEILRDFGAGGNRLAEVVESEVLPRLIPAGAIFMWGGAVAAPGFLLCDGTAISRAAYADLFAAIGTTYGVGDGFSTFNLPDLRQRFPLGLAASGTGATLGGTG